ncbi:MAG TPA: 3-deoxy-manno-octulosonate cytidylyltransferase [Smithellaceae bacterium]|nr:3-deoxy-manno-octulosonate cytidylyltransferase [Smithellaceae bacterium]HRS82020.1 3-deoxy-manno-octulosonate cytidylyltransferase [Smithellaceae bacterium]HRV44231.1 3-deoxy-manno-octulosonate cytidylyltransferase [Smithellaceae bacterium]
MKRDVVCIIPSRYESSRFPGKPLADLFGKPMIQHVYERVAKAGAVPYVAVATDDQRIFDAVKKFGGHAVMTSASHRSGTDRIAEAVQSLNLPADAMVVNIQGDQPIFEPVQVDEVIAPLIADPAAVMSTLVYKIVRPEEITHPHAVKVVFDSDFHALYFSRSTIPFVRDKNLAADYYKHHGIYAYRRDFLDIFTKLPEGKLEKLEALEQLRALEYGYKIKVAVTSHDSVEVDNEQELDRVRRILQERSSSGSISQSAGWAREG